MKLTVINGTMDQKEQEAYVDYLERKYGRKVEELTIHMDGEYVDLDYVLSAVPFERIRGIARAKWRTMDN